MWKAFLRPQGDKGESNCIIRSNLWAHLDPNYGVLDRMVDYQLAFSVRFIWLFMPTSSWLQV